MEIESYSHGEPCWQDQSSDDAGKAADFYTGLFGWEIPPPPSEGDEYGGYRNASLNGRVVAGISPKMDAANPTVWSIYIKTDDSAATMEKVKANGGQVMFEPMAVGTFGTMAICVDPTGAVFGTWEPNEHKGAGLRGEPGTVIWYELTTDDPAKASAFYSAVFDWLAQDHAGATSPGGYTELSTGGRAFGGLLPKGPEMPADMPNYWGIYIATDDTDASVARATELGGRLLMGPIDIEPGRLAVISDSTGAVFNVLKTAMRS